VELSPLDRHIWRALGVAQFRSGDWRAATESLRKAMDLGTGGEPVDRLFLAMAKWRQGDRGGAGRWYDKAVANLSGHPSNDGDFVGTVRAEAAALLSHDGSAMPRGPDAFARP
jgi:hypothetical protein